MRLPDRSINASNMKQCCPCVLCLLERGNLALRYDSTQARLGEKSEVTESTLEASRVDFNVTVSYIIVRDVIHVGESLSSLMSTLFVLIEQTICCEERIRLLTSFFLFPQCLLYF